MNAFWLFNIPWFFGLFCFFIGPIVASLYFSFTQFDGLNPAVFVGLDNYLKMISDPTFALSLKITFLFAAIVLPLNTFLAISFALLLNQKIIGQSLYRTLLYIPSIVPIIATSIVWIWLFNFTPGWLSDPKMAFWCLVVMSCWSVGNPMLIYLAGLQNIPEELYEAAELDGAGELLKLTHITLPLLAPTMIFNITIGIIQIFQYFVPAYVMTHGGPQNSTMFFSLYTYQTAFDDFEMGYASALAWVLFLIVMLFTFIASRFQRS